MQQWDRGGEDGEEFCIVPLLEWSLFFPLHSTHGFSLFKSIVHHFIYCSFFHFYFSCSWTWNGDEVRVEEKKENIQKWLVWEWEHWGKSSGEKTQQNAGKEASFCSSGRFPSLRALGHALHSWALQTERIWKQEGSGRRSPVQEGKKESHSSHCNPQPQLLIQQGPGISLRE